jgi:GntR family transcriptional regulator
VARNKIEQPLKGLTSFTEEMIARGMSPGSRVLRFEKIASSAKLAGDLQLALDDPVYEIQRGRLADHFPMAIETTYIPAKLVGGLTEKEAEGSLYRFIAEGQPAGIGFAKQVIEASGARAMESQYLGIAEHSPVLLIRRKAFLSDGTPFETVKSVYRADRYKYIIDMNRIQD